MALYNLSGKPGAAFGTGAGLIVQNALHAPAATGLPSPGRVVGCYLPVAIFALSLAALARSRKPITFA
jgi:hypothetical protein